MSSQLNIIIHSSEGSRSHIKPILEISELLLARGHSVTYAAAEEKLNYAKGYTIKTHSLGKYGKPDSSPFTNLQEMGKTSEGMVAIVQSLLLIGYEKTVQSLGDYLDNNKCDLLICDFAAGACSDIAQERGIPLIIGLQAIDVFGLVQAPFVTKTMSYGPITTKGLSLFERIDYQILEPLRMSSFMVPLQHMLDAAKRKQGFAPKPTLLGDFKYGLGLANTYFGFEPAMPLPPNIQLVGPILSPKPVKLDSTTEAFLNSHPRTLYISTGTNVVLEPSLFNSILNATQQAISQNIIDGAIWGLPNTRMGHFSSTEKQYLLSNSHLLMMKWAPQQSILEHANTKVHLSHCGLESTFESIASATKVLAMPFFGDQPRNAAKLVEMGIAEYVDTKASSALLVKKLHKLIHDPSNKIETHLHQAQRIAKKAARQVHLAADIVEEHTYLAKSCRLEQPYNPHSGVPPCEMAHVVPVSESMPMMAANMWDIQLLLFSLLMVGLYFLFKLSSKLRNLYNYASLCSKQNTKN
ncbi:hypothetical protein DSO57_1011066 [Entomophthora muscae]|uniref:Uncharacterized protein n=1 Tax=Entomophthora muscae TaxID=34485 RepID=A0ACC2TTT0_9FUNG|nr:hypothetical protein DSO57_1011066 [Entomophthora muscae]